MSNIVTRVLDEVVAEGQRLGRHVEHDARSWGYRIDDAVAHLSLRTKIWNRFTPILDQGSLGSCTGNAMAGWLGCMPLLNSTDPKDNTFTRWDEACAVELYRRATRLDDVPGEYPPNDTGSSGLAVAKAAKQLGYIHNYHHAFTTEGMIKAIQYAPVIVGVPWYEGFDNPQGTFATVKPTGEIRGGHEFLVRGYVYGSTPSRSWFIADNSWGTGWGDKGSFRFSVTTWNKLRTQQADVTVPLL